jgi:Cd2+/Zn2+-exporting ATPase
LAVVRHAKDSGPSLEHAENYRAINGKGAEATIAGHAYFVGNHRLAHELGVCSDKLEARLAGIESQAKSVVIVGHRPHADCAGEVLGILTVGDAIRPNAAEALRRIHAFGIRKVVMPSGDNTRTKPCFFRSRFSVMRPCGWPSLPTPGTTLLVVANALRLLGKIRQ